MRKRRVGIALLGAAVLVSLIPYASSHCPSWDVRVVDEQARPVTGANVRLTYRHYSAEGESHHVDRITGVDGRAAFPSQTLRASLLRRGYFTAMASRAFVHASYGPHAFVFAYGDGMDGSMEEWDGSPAHMTSTLVLRRR